MERLHVIIVDIVTIVVVIAYKQTLFGKLRVTLKNCSNIRQIQRSLMDSRKVQYQASANYTR
ncbi:MAG: hypothetical protein PHX74_08790 [Candidatus Sumerlaeales bacterium]|nr:hypothetical protein [Candidatus Sumerlaeales bacterium]